MVKTFNFHDKNFKIDWLIEKFRFFVQCFIESRLEGWLSIPKAQNIRRHGFKKQYVVVSSSKIIFYNSEADKALADPVMILNLNKLFHVRPVTQGDVIRADAKDIPRIFQVSFNFCACLLKKYIFVFVVQFMDMISNYWI